MTTTSSNPGSFLSDYAALLLRSGATCVRLEKNVQRIADAWGITCTITIMPRHIHLVVTDSNGHCDTFITPTGKTLISYNLITRLSKLSWNIADSKLSLAQASALLENVKTTRCANPWWTLFAVACANSSFCRLFGGDFAAMAVVFIATLAGYYLKQTMLGYKFDVRATFIACATVSSILSTGALLFSIGNTPEVAIATSVLYLVPGIPFINAFTDMIDGHYICFFCRMTDAVMLTCCLSLGLCIGMKLMNVGMF